MKSISAVRSAKNFFKSHFFIYSVLVFAAAVVIFMPFLQNRTSFIWEPDGVSQHFTAFVYYGEYIREIVRSVFAGSASLPQFDFSIGLGSDILQSLQYYAIGDPLNLISALVPKEYSPYAYTLVMALRYYLAGLAFIALAKYKKLPASASAAGALIYVFSAYSMYMAIRHPSFLNPMIYFPLIILGAEMIFDKKRPYVFILSVFLAAVSCFYYFYVLSLFTVLYIFLRIFFVYGRGFVKGFFESLLKFGGFYILAVMMAAVIFFPLVGAFFSASRGGLEYGWGLVFSRDYYENFLGAFFSTQMIGNKTYMGFTVLAAGGAVLLFASRRENGFLKAALIAVTLFMLLPAFDKAANGFSYVVNRWSWVYGLLCAYIFAKCTGNPKRITVKKSLLVCAAAVLSTAVMIAVKSLSSDENYIACAVFLAFGALCLACSLARRAKTQVSAKKCGAAFKGLAALLCAAGVIVNGFYTFNPRATDYVDSFMTFKNAREYANGSETAALKELQEEGGGIERYISLSLLVSDYNASLINGTYSACAYLSMIDSDIVQFQQDMGLINRNLSCINDTLWDPFLNPLLNVRFCAAKSVNDSRYGLSGDPLGSVSYTDGGDYKIYENEYFVPFGFTYSNVISQAEYEKLNPAEKRLALLDCVVLNDADGQNTAAADEYASQCGAAELRVLPGDGAVADGNRIYVAEDNTKITLAADEETPENSQIYFYAQNIAYSPITDADFEKAQKGESAQTVRRDTFRKVYSLENGVGVKASANSRTESFQVYTAFNDYYTGVFDHCLNMGYSADALGSVELTLKKGVYEFDSLSLLSVPMNGYENSIQKLRAETLQNVSVTADKISGSISSGGDKWLYLSVPYSENWSVYVDGEEAALYRADSAFCAVRLTAGEHSVELKYENKIMLYSLPVSIAGAAVFTAVAVIYERKRRKETKPE